MGRNRKTAPSGPGKRRAKAFAGLLCLALLFSGALPSFATRNYNYQNTEVNQENAQTLATKINNDGSDDSEDEGIKNGTTALNCLGALQIGCAFHYGYKGYGNYINSQKLDDLHRVTRNLDGTMTSIGYNALSGNAGGSGTNTRDQSTVSGAKKWANKDTAFLYKGEMNEAASKFEKMSGMSREELFRHIASGVDAGLSWDDPNLLPKLETRYQDFVAGIPNKDFKSNLEKAHTLFNLAKKLDFLGQIRDFYVKNRYDGPGQGETRLAGNVSSPPTAAAPAQVVANPAETNRGIASVDTGPTVGTSRLAQTDDSTPKLSRDEGMYLGLEGTHGDLLADITQEGDTIFRIVSKRYRKLTPALIGKASVINSR